MKIRKTIICLCSFCCTLLAVAQPKADTLLLRYRQMALEYNDDLKAAAKNIAASVELERAARADFSPRLSAGADFQYTGNPLELSAELPGAGPITVQGKDTKYGFSATLMQPVYTGGRIIQSIRLAESRQAIAGMQEEMLRSLVCFQVDVQYWNTVARLEMVNVAEDFRNSISELTRIVKERVDAGLTDSQELLTAEVKLNEADYRLLQAKSDFEIGLMALNALIGVPLDEKTVVGTKVASLENPSGIADGEQTRPEVRIARERIEIEKSSLKLNDSKYKPQLHIGLNGGYFSPGYDFKSDLSPNYTVYAQLSVPLFEGGKRRREKRAAKYRVGMASDNLHKVETDVELEARTARTALVQAEQRMKLAAASLDKARENETRATEKYEEGAISIAEVIDAQVYRQTAETNHVAAKTAAQMHYAELLKAVNGYDYR